MTDIHRKIYDNLRDRISGVNMFAALHGIDDFCAGHEALEEMIQSGEVVVNRVATFEQGVLNLYRLRPRLALRPVLVVDNDKRPE